jgi:hypothetical protein
MGFSSGRGGKIRPSPSFGWLIKLLLFSLFLLRPGGEDIFFFFFLEKKKKSRSFARAEK